MTDPLRLIGVLVDVPAADHERAVAFWTAALGKPPEVAAALPQYAQFPDVTPGLYFMVQATADGTPRVHLDFDTADRDAVVERLASIGATELSRRHHWVVMQDPATVPFCIMQRTTPAGGSAVADA